MTERMVEKYLEAYFDAGTDDAEANLAEREAIQFFSRNKKLVLDYINLEDTSLIYKQEATRILVLAIFHPSVELFLTLRNHEHWLVRAGVIRALEDLEREDLIENSYGTIELKTNNNEGEHDKKS